MKPTRLLLLLAASLMFFLNASAESLKVGDKAPVLTATTDAGTSLNIGEVYAKNK